MTERHNHTLYSMHIYRMAKTGEFPRCTTPHSTRLFNLHDSETNILSPAQSSVVSTFNSKDAFAKNAASLADVAQGKQVLTSRHNATRHTKSHLHLVFRLLCQYSCRLPAIRLLRGQGLGSSLNGATVSRSNRRSVKRALQAWPTELADCQPVISTPLGRPLYQTFVALFQAASDDSSNT